MDTKHLTPDEIGLLLDDEVRPGAPALAVHLDACPICRARLADERQLTALLAGLPRQAPSHQFADRVMAQVPVFVPWYVTASDTLRHYTPRSRRGRVIAFALAALSGSILSGVIAWVVMRPDLLVFGVELAEDRIRTVVVSAGADLVTAAFGAQAGSVVSRFGGAGIAVMGLALVAATAATLAGLRAIAFAVARRRS